MLIRYSAMFLMSHQLKTYQAIFPTCRNVTRSHFPSFHLPGSHLPLPEPQPPSRLLTLPEHSNMVVSPPQHPTNLPELFHHSDHRPCLRGTPPTSTSLSNHISSYFRHHFPTLRVATSAVRTNFSSHLDPFLPSFHYDITYDAHSFLGWISSELGLLPLYIACSRHRKKQESPPEQNRDPPSEFPLLSHSSIASPSPPESPKLPPSTTESPEPSELSPELSESSPEPTESCPLPVSSIATEDLPVFVHTLPTARRPSPCLPEALLSPSALSTGEKNSFLRIRPNQLLYPITGKREHDQLTFAWRN